ncbi:MAG: hypothetical protein INR65_09645 [Gluconacetobacter diazotrophicus]|nr:hypothetical protein [Gluconacetobacter diazotrophicus]
MSLMPLPPYAPEPNPIKRVRLDPLRGISWRERFLSHRLLGSYAAIVDARCQAWNRLTPTASARSATTPASNRSTSELNGTTSMNGACMTQDTAGDILVCIEHGVFSYDGRRFLGAEHGLPDGGIVSGISLSRTGGVAIQYTNQFHVSDRATDAAHPASAQTFTAVTIPPSTSSAMVDTGS